MPTVSSSITINQPVEKVFAYVIAVENHRAWQTGVLEAKVTPDGPVGVGSIYHYTSEVMGHRMQTQLQVSAFEPNQKWSVKTTGVPTPVETVYLFEAAGSGTKLTVSMELAGGFPAAAEAMVKQQMQKSMDEQARRVKQMVEK
ncbi:MAG: SRPBCC family protein [Chloroflexi bacterium]|nr:SRPBCC family protein [Chloroflexota bacterium]